MVAASTVLRLSSHKVTSAIAALELHCSALHCVTTCGVPGALEEDIYQHYGGGSLCFSHRFASSTHSLKMLSSLYKQLLLWPCDNVRSHFVSLLVSELKMEKDTPKLNKLDCSTDGTQQISLKTETLPHPAETERIGDVRTPAEVSGIPGLVANVSGYEVESFQPSAQEWVPGDPSPVQNGHQAENMGGSLEHEPQMKRLSLKRQLRKILFSLGLLGWCASQQILNSEQSQVLWDMTATVICQNKLWLDDERLRRGSVIVLRTISSSRPVARDNRGDQHAVPYRSVSDELTWISWAMVKCRGIQDYGAVICLSKWAIDLVSPFRGQFLAIPQELLDVVLNMMDNVDCTVRNAVSGVLCALFEVRAKVNVHHLAAAARALCQRSSDIAGPDAQLVVAYVHALAPYCFAFSKVRALVDVNGIPVNIHLALQPRSRTFRTSQLGRVLDQLSQGVLGDASPGGHMGSTMVQLLQKPTDLSSIDAGPKMADWVPRLVHSLSAFSSDPQSDVQGDDGNMCIVQEPFPLERLTTVNHMFWFLVHEALRQCIGTRLRTHLGGAMKLFSWLERTLLAVKERQQEHRMMDAQCIWMLVEYIVALEKAVYCGYEGSAVLMEPPKSCWAFFCGNKKTCEECFNRLRPLVMNTSQAAGHHQGAVHAAMEQLQVLEKQLPGLPQLDSMCLEVGNGKEVGSGRTMANEDVLQVIQGREQEEERQQVPEKQRLQDRLPVAWEQFLEKVSTAVQVCCLGLCRLKEGDAILGIFSYLRKTFGPTKVPSGDATEDACSYPFGWVQGVACQAAGCYERAHGFYAEFLMYGTEQMPKASALSTGTAIGTAGQFLAQSFRPFVVERIGECYCQLSDWHGFRSFAEIVRAGQMVDEGKRTATLNRLLDRGELLAVCDGDNLAEAVAKLCSWTTNIEDPSLGCSGPNQVMEDVEDHILKALAALKCCIHNQQVPGGLISESTAKICSRLQMPVQLYAEDSPELLTPHLLNLHCLRSLHLALKKYPEVASRWGDSKLAADGILGPSADRKMDDVALLPLQLLCSGGRDADHQRELFKLLLPEICHRPLCADLQLLDPAWMLKLSRVLEGSSTQTSEDATFLLTLVAAHVARNTDNPRLSSRLLNTLPSSNGGWQDLLVCLQHSEGVHRTGGSSARSAALTMCWEAVASFLQSTGVKGWTAQVAAAACLRLSSWLSGVDNRDATLGDSLAAASVDWGLLVSKLGNQWRRLMDSAGGEQLSSGSIGTQVTRVHCACVAGALTLAPSMARAFREYGNLLYSLTQEAESKTKLSTFPEEAAGHLAGYAHTLAAYCQYLHMVGNSGNGHHTFEQHFLILLRVLHIVVYQGVHLAGPALDEPLARVPPAVWQVVTPQLFSHLGDHQHAVRQYLQHILQGVIVSVPSAVLYPAAVEMRRAEHKGEHLLDELQALISELQQHYPDLLGNLMVLMEEMERITVLWEEQWCATLTELHLDVQRRTVALQAEAQRLRDNHSLDQQHRAAMLRQRFVTLMSPVILTLEKRLRSTVLNPAETPAEEHMQAMYMKPLTAAIAGIRNPTHTLDVPSVQTLWAPLKGLWKQLGQRLKSLKMSLGFVSPRLLGLQDTSIPMPGHTGSGVTIANFKPEVLVLSTKTRPKKLAMLGSDGEEYVYLLKGREDLHLDERLMQFLRVANGLLQDHALTKPSGLRARWYTVTPLAGRVGLIQWVPNTVSMYGLFKAWQERQLERHQAMTEAMKQEPEGRAGPTTSPSKGSPPSGPPPAAAMRPVDLFFSRMMPALNEAGLERHTPRKDWPIEVMKKVFSGLKRAVPQQLLAKDLWCGSGTSAAWWQRVRQYSQSLAVMSIAGHILGLGDRHLDNILLDKQTAEVVHIDYNVCFEKGLRLRVPELVPFRLTQTLQASMSLGGLSGIFLHKCTDVLTVMRDNKAGLKVLLDAMLSDPTVDWAAERHERAARKDMDLAVSLQLFASRVEELRQPLQIPSVELLPRLDECVTVCQVYLELHQFMATQQHRLCHARRQVADAQSTLASAAAQEGAHLDAYSKASEVQAKCISDMQTVQSGIQRVVSHCQGWVYRHLQVVGTLKEATPSVLSTRQPMWHSGASTTSLELVLKSGTSRSQTILESVLGRAPSTSVLPTDVLRQCVALDRQGCNLLQSRDSVVAGALKSLTQYSAILKHLLPQNYWKSSQHYKWAECFQAALATAPENGFEAAQQLAPKVPPEDSVTSMWRALITAYTGVGRTVKSQDTQGMTPTFGRLENDAASKEEQLQAALCDTSGDADLAAAAIVTVCKALLEWADEPLSTKTLPRKSPPGFQEETNGVAIWAQKLHGLAKLLKLLACSEVGKMALLGRNATDDNVSSDISVRYSWLNALEKYSSEAVVAYKSFRMGSLVDVAAVFEEGPDTVKVSITESVKKAVSELEAVLAQAWELENLRLDHADFLMNYDEKVSSVAKSLREVQESAFNSGLAPEELQGLATQQQELVANLQQQQLQWDQRDEVQAHINEHADALKHEATLVAGRLASLMERGCPGSLAAEEEGEAVQWGSFEIPVWRPLAKIFKRLENAEQHLSPYVDGCVEAAGGEMTGNLYEDQELFPSGFRQWNCLLEQARWLRDLVMAVSERARDSQPLNTQSRTRETGQGVAILLETRLLAALEARVCKLAPPVFRTGIQELVSALEGRPQVTCVSALEAGSHPKDAMPESCSGFFGDVVDAPQEVLGELEMPLEAEEEVEEARGSWKSSSTSEKQLVKFADFERGLDSSNDLLEPLEGSRPESRGKQDDPAKELKSSHERVPDLVELMHRCLDAGGNYSLAQIQHRAVSSWVAELKLDQTIRLHNLAAFEWVHDSEVPRETGARGLQYVGAYFRCVGLADLPEDLQRDPLGRSQIVSKLQGALKGLSELDPAYAEWDQQSEAMSQQLHGCVRAAALEGTLPGMDGPVTAQALQGYLNRRVKWLNSAKEYADNVASIMQAVLQFEHSRNGQLWAPDQELSPRTFNEFQEWLCQLDGASSSLKAAQADVRIFHAQSANLQNMATRASAVMKAALVEEARTSSQFSEHAELLISSGGATSEKLGAVVTGMAAAAEPIENDMKSLFNELSSVTSGHRATRDVHQLVGKVLEQHSGLLQTLQQIRETVPVVVKMFEGCIDAKHSQDDTASTSADEAKAVALAETRDLWTQVEVCSGLCAQASKSLQSLCSALDSLLTATNSISVALQSEHGLEEDIVDPADAGRVDGSIARDSNDQEQDLGSTSALASERPEDGANPQQCSARQWLSVAGLSQEIEGSQAPVIAGGLQAAFQAAAASDDVSETVPKRERDEDGRTGECEGDVGDVPPSGPGTKDAQHGGEPSSWRPPAGEPQGETHGGTAASQSPVVVGRRGRSDAVMPSRLVRGLSQEQKTYAASVLGRCIAKLGGREREGGAQLTALQEVERLIQQATSTENLCRMYEGWTPWI
ncbi:unnamed protein product [Ostreobium quekettii]|uniref:non-specific serine/threonine protein kinase n=1 Tax=Ostreobium quekettii TaxID=121088 RepID=A0A8S1IV33_9CHLO|nr:unnamed protein product [Ostreobium quekettii]